MRQIPLRRPDAGAGVDIATKRADFDTERRHVAGQVRENIAALSITLTDDDALLMRQMAEALDNP